MNLFALTALIALESLQPAPDARDWWAVSNQSGILKVWSEANSLSCEGDLCAINELSKYQTAPASGAAILIDWVEYDCKNRQTRTLQETRFDATGMVLQRIPGPPSAWLDATPGSIGEASMTFACHFKDLRAGNPSATVFEVSGHAFQKQAVWAPIP